MSRAHAPKQENLEPLSDEKRTQSAPRNQPCKL